MRVTTQMLNSAAAAAGRTIKTSSLLDYIQGNDTNTLASVLSQNTQKASVQKEKYEKMEEQADAVLEQLAQLAAQDEKSLFSVAKGNGKTEDVVKTIQKLVAHYNQAMENLAKQPDTLSQYYVSALKQVVSDQKGDLEKIGLTQDKRGLLQVDVEKLKATDVTTLEKVFGNKGSFSVKTAYVLARVSEYAYSNLESLSNQYTKSGKSYLTQTMSKYNLKG